MLHIALAHYHGSIVLHYVQVSRFIYSAFGGHMCRFQFAITTNSIAMNIFIHFFVNISSRFCGTEMQESNG